MATWEARVSRESAPAERVDAELRYVLAAPLIARSALWLDLGCGTGIAARNAWHPEPPRARAILVDRDATVLADARRESGVEVVAAVEADLESREGADAVRAVLAEVGAEPGHGIVVTCFGVLHQLADFSVLVELLLGLADAGATVILSVPDDAAGGLQDPYRRSAWSASAAEELRRLLPKTAVRLRQVPLRGSAIVADGTVTEVVEPGRVAVGAEASGSQHLLAFGPRAGQLAAVGRVRVADLDAERAEARRRESDLAYLEARVAQLEAPAGA